MFYTRVLLSIPPKPCDGPSRVLYMSSFTFSIGIIRLCQPRYEERYIADSYVRPLYEIYPRLPLTLRSTSLDFGTDLIGKRRHAALQAG